jgi:hypothetical protein
MAKQEYFSESLDGLLPVALAFGLHKAEGGLETLDSGPSLHEYLCRIEIIHDRRTGRYVSCNTLGMDKQETNICTQGYGSMLRSL